MYAWVLWCVGRGGSLACWIDSCLSACVRACVCACVPACLSACVRVAGNLEAPPLCGDAQFLEGVSDGLVKIGAIVRPDETVLPAPPLPVSVALFLPPSSTFSLL